MNGSLLFSLAFIFAVTAGADAGAFRRTTDGRALVWNNEPRPGDSASWDGPVDSDGYATGFGTLTWFKYGEWAFKYSGPMSRGRLHGYINNVDADGDAFAGTIKRGIKQSDWHKIRSLRAYLPEESDGGQPEITQSRRQTIGERQDEARAWLVTFMATRFMAHNAEPTDFSEALLIAFVKWGSDLGIDDSLATLFPEASSTERALIRGFLIALTEGKLSSDAIAGQITKEVFMAELQKRDPALAAKAEIGERAWELLRQSLEAANRKPRE